MCSGESCLFFCFFFDRHEDMTHLQLYAGKTKSTRLQRFSYTTSSGINMFSESMHYAFRKQFLIQCVASNLTRTHLQSMYTICTQVFNAGYVCGREKEKEECNRVVLTQRAIKSMQILLSHLFIYVHGSTVTSMTYRKPAQQNKKIILFPQFHLQSLPLSLWSEPRMCRGGCIHERFACNQGNAHRRESAICLRETRQAKLFCRKG